MRNNEQTRIVIDDAIVERLGVTRAKVEAAAVSGSAVVAVTSARSTDGADLLAYGLAQSLAKVGRSVLLVRSNPSGPSGSGRRLTIVNGTASGPSFLEVAESYSLDAARAAFGDFKDRFAFTIVSAGLASKSGSALSLVGAADFVLIAVEQGRSTHSDDRDLALTLREAQSNMLGVVTIERKAIRSFVRESAEATVTGNVSSGSSASFPTFFPRADKEDATLRAQPLASRLG